MEFQFTDDASAATPTVLDTRKYSFTSADAARGTEDIKISTLLDGYRVIYSNGPTTQGEFVLDSVLRVNSNGNRYNRGGALLITEFDTEVALGLVSNYSIDTKFGSVKNIDAADNAVDVWALADDDRSPRLDTKTFPSTASVFYLASSSASDTAVTVEVGYVAEDGIGRTTTVALNGQSSVSLGFSALDVNRMKVTSSTAAVGDIYCITADNFAAGGVPNTIAQTVAFIPAGYGQTQQTMFTLPAKQRAVIKSFDISMSRDNGATGSGIVTLRLKESGKSEKVIREFFPTTNSPTTKPRANIVIPPLAQVVWRLDDASDGNTNVTITWDFEIIDD